MAKADAILLADFEDKPRPSYPPEPGPRPTDRPRPRPATPPQGDSINVAAFDSDAERAPAARRPTSNGRAALPFDLGVFDPQSSSFLVVYSTGAVLSALNSRTISIPGDADVPITSLTVHSRKAGEAHAVPYRTFHFPHDIRGKQLTLRFKDAAEPETLLVECDSRNGASGEQVHDRHGNGNGSVNESAGQTRSID